METDAPAISEPSFAERTTPCRIKFWGCAYKKIGSKSGIAKRILNESANGRTLQALCTVNMCFILQTVNFNWSLAGCLCRLFKDGRASIARAYISTAECIRLNEILSPG